tara:strand:- start:1410 stop:1547 length:138 start_codon:yes stop_codon:yes gene_type:complete
MKEEEKSKKDLLAEHTAHTLNNIMDWLLLPTKKDKNDGNDGKKTQ